MATKEKALIDPQSCFNRAFNHEPIFVLIGRDESAPQAIRAWIAERVFTRKNKTSDPQMMEAEACAKEMEKFYAERQAMKTALNSEFGKVSGK